MMIAGPLFLMWVPVLVMVVILTVKMKVHIALGLLENKCKHIAQLLHIGIAYWGVLQGYVVDVMLKWHRYACSGFSLIGFYLVTVLEEANVAIPPLQVRSWSSPINSPCFVISIEDPPQASLLLVIWRLILSVLSSYLLLRCTFSYFCICISRQEDALCICICISGPNDAPCICGQLFWLQSPWQVTFSPPPSTYFIIF